MERLFEEFIGRFLFKYASQVGLAGTRIHLQSHGCERWLLRAENGDHAFRLRPDVLIEADDHSPRMIIDTKWKRVETDKGDRRGGAREADLYQLYAYANRFASPRNVLLYPAVSGTEAKTFWLANDEMQRSIHIEFIELGYRLHENVPRLQQALRDLVQRVESGFTGR